MLSMLSGWPGALHGQGWERVAPASACSWMSHRPQNIFRWWLMSHQQADESPYVCVSDTWPPNSEPGRAQTVESPGVFSVGNGTVVLLSHGLCPVLRAAP